jgi:hypothetical protein
MVVVGEVIKPDRKQPLPSVTPSTQQKSDEQKDAVRLFNLAAYDRLDPD